MFLVAKDKVGVTPNSEEHLRVGHVCPARLSREVEQPGRRRRRVVQVSAPLSFLLCGETVDETNGIVCGVKGMQLYDTAPPRAAQNILWRPPLLPSLREKTRPAIPILFR